MNQLSNASRAMIVVFGLIVVASAGWIGATSVAASETVDAGAVDAQLVSPMSARTIADLFPAGR